MKQACTTTSVTCTSTVDPDPGASSSLSPVPAGPGSSPVQVNAGEAINVKGAQSPLNDLKSLAKLFNFVVFQSVSIFSILNHPCSCMLCYILFGVFLSL